MKEKVLQKKVLDWLRSQPQTWAVKYHGGPYSEVGVPDVLACVEGRFLAIELKGAGGRVAPIQAVQIGRIDKAGGVALVAYSLTDVQDAVATMLA